MKRSLHPEAVSEWRRMHPQESDAPEAYVRHVLNKTTAGALLNLHLYGRDLGRAVKAAIVRRAA